MHQPGTRFLLYPQPPFLEGFGEPEMIEVSSPAGSVGPGPSDDKMYAVYPLNKQKTYGEPFHPGGEDYGPPWDGPAHTPALPDRHGHFDHLTPGTPQFEQAHVFGSVRFCLDVWEGYFDRPINWHFGDMHQRMEIVITPEFPNATMGYGFLEIGSHHMNDGSRRPFTLNFDILGHEVGHSIMYPIIGLPDPELVSNDYFGFHESAADMIGVIASMHFDSVLDELLANTSGNLYALNKLNRMAELSQNKQIRIVANDLTLWDFSAGWTDEHALGQPLSAAIFDILVDLFHESLQARGLISEQMENLSDALEFRPDYDIELQYLFDEVYHAYPGDVREALTEARDFVGTYMALSFGDLTPSLRYGDVAGALLDAERFVSNGQYRELVGHNLRRRGLGVIPVGPRLKEPDADSHAFSVRTAVPNSQPTCALRRRRGRC